MSRVVSKPVRYKCDNDCRMEGCPGREMRVTRMLTSDTVVVEVDGEIHAVFGDGQFCARWWKRGRVYESPATFSRFSA